MKCRSNLKQSRIRMELTQKEMAELIPCDVRYYRRLENGESLGSVQMWDRIERILRKPQQWLRKENAPEGTAIPNESRH